MNSFPLARCAFALSLAATLFACAPPGPDAGALCLEQKRVCGPPTNPGASENFFSCGACARAEDTCNAAGQCETRVCKPLCPKDAECGDDGCGGTCGAVCATASPDRPACMKNKCVATCTPDCTGKECGDNGCGGSCGTCEAGTECKADQFCAPPEWTFCAGAAYTDAASCDCGCGTKDPDCDLEESFLSGCGVGELCDPNGACAPIAPSGWTCSPDAYGDGRDCNCECGLTDPDCSIATAAVFGCQYPGDACTNGSCGPCTPNCGTNNCGGDGCGGHCGPTGPVSATGPLAPDGNGGCQSYGLCIGGTCTDPCPQFSTALLCWTNECGNNACGGTCGTCDTVGGEVCDKGRCVVPEAPPAANSCRNVGCAGRAPSGCYCDVGCSAPDRNNCCPDQPNVCCEAQCDNKECGSDGCGGECGDCGVRGFCGTDFQCAPNAPTGLVFSAPTGSFAEGVPIFPIVPYSSGGAIATYSILPELPAGLSIATGSGVISGTPIGVSPATTYTVTGTNRTGTTTGTLSIEVTPSPPSNLSYSQNPVVYTEGTAIAPNVPAFTGGTPTSYASLPLLPTGLSIGPTGVITGTPGAAAPSGTYTVTAQNGVGSTSVDLVIRVRPRAPSGLSYTDETPVYSVGAAIATNSPSLSVGTATLYTVMPALPTGLVINPTTGEITGTPTQTIMTSNIVTASNETGSTNVMINITVNAAPLGDWAQQAFVKAYNSEASDKFGADVAIAGDFLAVGAPSEAGNGVGVYSPTGPDNNGKPESGAVYIYRRTGSSWGSQPMAYLKSATLDTSDFPRFGHSVAMSTNTLIVGAPEENFGAPFVIEAGAAYVYFFNGTSWTQQGWLFAPTGSVGLGPTTSAFFGSDVAIDGDTAVVGARNEGASTDGSAYVFTRTAGNWTPQARLTAPTGGVGDQFGSAVAVSGDTIIVGAYNEDGLGTDSGAAYIYTRSANVWTLQAYVKPSTPHAQQHFGISVALDGNTALIGADGDESLPPAATGATSSGAAFVFTRSGNVWSQQARLKASNVDASDGFGEKVALVGNSALIGARSEQSLSTQTITGPTGGSGSENDTGFAVGAAYLFNRSGTTWSQGAYFKAPNADDSDQFGVCALSATTVVVGAIGESSADTGISAGTGASADNSSSSSGAVYVYTRN
jgi:hypothetical protein